MPMNERKEKSQTKVKKKQLCSTFNPETTKNDSENLPLYINVQKNNLMLIPIHCFTFCLNVALLHISSFI